MKKHYALEGFYDKRGDYKAAGKQVYKAEDAKGFAVGLDTTGTLLWGDNTKEQFGRPLIIILSEWASQDYLDYLKSKDISYITIGDDSLVEYDEVTGAGVSHGPYIDLVGAMEILRKDFGIERLAVVGGGHINGSMLDLGLLDEISMMYGYGIDGREEMAAAFYGRPKNRKPVRLQFQSVKEKDGIVWMRYLVNKDNKKG